MELYGKEIGKQELKDTLAWVVIYGGSSATITAIAAAAVAAGIIDRGQSIRYVSHAKQSVHFKDFQDKAWKTYKQTGSIDKAIDVFFS